MSDRGNGSPLLSVEDVAKWFRMPRSPLEFATRQAPSRLIAVDGVSFTLAPNEVLGIVGESGSGKSTLARCLVGLYRPDEGRVLFAGRDTADARGPERRALHRRMQMVFQDPFTSLNPRMSIGAAIAEAGLVHGRVAPGGEEEFVGRLLDLVGLAPEMARRRPRALSGGQRQRVAIARALAVEPEVLIADEVVSALDVSIQAQILNLFAELRRRLGLAMVFIAHDLAVVSHISTTVAVMYLGRIVEIGPVDEVFGSPQHPYTQALLEAHPDPYELQPDREPSLSGDVPSPLAIPSGCRFRTRCAYSEARCEIDDPVLLPEEAVRSVACHVLPFRVRGGTG